MGEMTVRIDEKLLTRIESLARNHRRSLDQEVEDLLLTAVEGKVGPTASKESLYEASRRIAAMTPRDVIQTDSVDLLREDRNR
ncbi:hypothetical protein BJF92_20465 [Rhizobium rhizosphaerae]|uniref:Arc-like DNA binding domain-containing protein n=1 Tax=Xaviernesmea rhizosphaerae TaxID=1672749 RepID=A0A1Q9ALP6_9HYPH|nr:hypothetical protein [Xaviernesmea rhizosphaerae]OLP56169.1 hypothetical protein BJF92_20465 [Xaviernesmea rhizosphaerae]OQP86971.1 hypothetical protein BTR14_08555 [Xaviernesmea rhizosphaerae]